MNNFFKMNNSNMIIPVNLQKKGNFYRYWPAQSSVLLVQPLDEPP